MDSVIPRSLRRICLNKQNLLFFNTVDILILFLSNPVSDHPGWLTWLPWKNINYSSFIRIYDSALQFSIGKWIFIVLSSAQKPAISLVIQAWCKLALQCIGVMNYRIETTPHSELSWREIVEIFLVNYSCGSRWADFRRVHVKAFHSYYGSCIFWYKNINSINQDTYLFE